jgi:uncharacterized membrane protein YgcG
MADKNYYNLLYDAMNAGADADSVEDLLNQRTSKALADTKLNKYAYDDMYKQASEYIKSKRSSQQVSDALDKDYTDYIPDYAKGSSTYTPTPFSYEKPEAYSSLSKYQSKYSDQIDRIVGSILNGSYDKFLQSGEYGALSKEYSGKGQDAMQNTLAQVSARTGGLASSYAGQAGQQTYDKYMDELTSAALQMYQNQRADKYNQLSALTGLDNTDYGRFADLVGEATNNEETAYNRWQNQDNTNYSRAADADNTAYSRYRNGVSDAEYNDETTYNRQQDALDRQDAADKTAYDRASSIAETMAGIGDYSGLKALGYTDAQIKELTDAYQAAAAAKAAKASSSGRSGSGRSGSGRSGSGRSGSGRSGSGKSSGSSKITSAIIGKMQSYSDNEDNEGMEKYLQNMLYAGKLTQDDVDYLYDQYTTEKAPAPDILSEGEFYRSSSMVKKYGTYAKYVQSVRNNYGG